MLQLVVLKHNAESYHQLHRGLFSEGKDELQPAIVLLLTVASSRISVKIPFREKR
jgi:hypothetical protein